MKEKNISSIEKEKKEIDEKLRHYADESTDIVLKELNTSFNGLDDSKVEESRDEYGNNHITHGKKTPLIKKIFESFVNPFSAILFIIAIVTFIIDIYIPLKNNDPSSFNPITFSIIMVLILIAGIIRFVEETKSGNAAESLLKLITTTTAVKRNGKLEEIPLEDVVVGDIIQLSAGDLIPADLRIIFARDLFISQSALTGESYPVEKIDSNNQTSEALTDIKNLAFMGSNVISGSAEGVVLAVGNSTFFGILSQSLNKKTPPTGFEKGVSSVSMILIKFMLIMVPIVFLINGFTKGHWWEAFLFSITIAVGLTPEMLPMIVTTCLSKGAVEMSKKKTIVKNINSIQNLGAMDILCTDKTGTLTQDKVVLEYHLNVEGKEDINLLKYAFLNSYYQTGLKNLMDNSIIEKTEDESKTDPAIKEWYTSYEKVDEIPFDFNRRRMSVIVKNKEGNVKMITKGAVEEMFKISSFVRDNDKVIPFTKEIKDRVIKIVNDLNEDGFRVIALATKVELAPVGVINVSDENNMTLEGYLAFLDPPKESAASAIDKLQKSGVSVKILTGDNEKVTVNICGQVGLKITNLLLGPELDNMNDAELTEKLHNTNILAKLTPDQKARVVYLLKEDNHVVGYMGDGINDAPALEISDVGISVDSAVDIAKESADIILLQKDLNVLEDGILEGRKTYGNMIKYIKITASSNFGNVFSVLIASCFLPFLPIRSVHLIILNLLYEISCVALPWDNVDKEFLEKPRKWSADTVSSFMIYFGPTSSIFDIITFIFLYFFLCPMFISNGLLFHAIPESAKTVKDLYVSMFQSGWFIESMWSQILVIYMLRSPKIPFIQTKPSFQLITLSVVGLTIATILPNTLFGEYLGFLELPNAFFPFLAIVILGYMTLTTIVKKIYIKKYKILF